MEVNFTLDEISAVAKQVISLTSEYTVWAFHGEMGAGKTTFIHACCEAMGVLENISSPTFSIINEYLGGAKQRIYHIDLYRLRDETEAINAGVEDCLFSGSTCFVEWPERAPGIFPTNSLRIHISAINDHTRRLEFELPLTGQ